MNDYQLSINGQRVPGASVIPVINPATGEVVAHAPVASAGQLDQAVTAATAAFGPWSALTVAQRRERLLGLAAVLRNHADELAMLLTLEQGKPLADARGEVAGAARFFEVFASYDLPVRVIEDSQTRRVEAYARPLGVVGAIIPWNFPLLTVAFKLPFALLAGNTVILKPAPTTPLATLRFGELAQALLPPGVLNVLSDDNSLGPLISAHEGVRKITFTGATTTGCKVFAAAAPTLKRLTLELGGNDAAIVLDDVEPQVIAPALFRAAFYNAGQVCLAIKRLYVQAGVYDAVVEALAAQVRQVVLGDGLQEGTTMGPVQNRSQYEKLKELLDATQGRGVFVTGGRAADRPGYFIEPTLVRDIEDGTRLVDEEQFGPVLPIIRVADEEDALRRANNSPCGLGASVWSRDQARASAVAQRLQAGTVWINKHAELVPSIPFSGAKQSGLGVEFAEAGLAEFTQQQIISIAR
ncbi:aldehyde dehydrogenase [Burkholderia cepacia]|uniref:aldehyde dehydrogenase family protein n=1 Tax=Burkholderia cepacia TaxID=292 RepID=UPI00075FBD53|nr:aldehyde dehydrogenase family protein [Burkholderia cepacia]KWE18346.1 aldehyde dehydrogenase [Burkholderia cepacia]